MTIKVGVIGVGNCASALVQGVHYYKDVKKEEDIPGVMHAKFGGYHIRDIEFTSAFDVNSEKVGKDLSEAIHGDPNCTAKFCDVPDLGVEVKPGPVLDGVAPHMMKSFHVRDDHTSVNVCEELKDSDTEIVVNFLPVGSAEASRYYAEAVLDAGCGFINCIPEFIASDKAWAKKFKEGGVPVAGDDIKSQLGATILHRALVELFHERGLRVDSTYQLNVGGNTDFENMTVEDRLASKRISKTEAVKCLVPYDMPTRIGPSDYIPFLDDHKVCFIRVEGRGFGNLPVELDLKLKVNDSPNSAGIVIDVIRAVRIAQDRGVSGPLPSVSAYAFKHPPRQVEDYIAREWVERYIKGRRKA